MSRKFSKDVEARLDGDLTPKKGKQQQETSKKQDTSKKQKDAPKSKSDKKPALDEDRIFVTVTIPKKAANQLLKAAGLPAGDGAELTAKVSTFK
jgi:hypothetical protein